MVQAVLTLLLGILVMLAIIAANGYFVAQEFAYMSVDRPRLAAGAKAGDQSAQRALDVTKRTSFMLSGAQLGITVTGLLTGYVAEPLVGESLGVILGGAGVPTAVSVSVGTVLALVGATIIQMIFGELYPKNLAIANPEPMAKRLARSTTIYLKAFGWLIVVFDRAANGLLRLFRVEAATDVDTTLTEDDLERVVADSRDSGDLPDDLALLIDRILDFPEQDVEHAMIPRSQVDVIRPDMTIGELRILMASAHTRYPVTNAQDEPIGVADLREVLRRNPPDDEVVSNIMRPPMVMPTSMFLPTALRQMGDTGNKLACVIDEYGGFAGVLTLEDMAEELVGEFTDEHDVGPDPQRIEVEAEGSWRMTGEVHIDEVERVIGYDLPQGDYETLAGILIAQERAFPEANEIVKIDLPADPRDAIREDPVHRVLEVEILTLDNFVPDKVFVRLLELPGEIVEETGGEQR
ncbi:MAG TPA: hemolysin family protein [Actinomycetaceae bacterium]|nr:hemolysin family protein [Actinomycetaceae bacterium]